MKIFLQLTMHSVLTFFQLSGTHSTFDLPCLIPPQALITFDWALSPLPLALIKYKSIVIH